MSLGSSSAPYFCTECYESIFPFQIVDDNDLIESFCHDQKINEVNMKSAAAFVGDGIDSEYVTASKFKGKYSQSDNLFLLHVKLKA